MVWSVWANAKPKQVPGTTRIDFAFDIKTKFSIGAVCQEFGASKNPQTNSRVHQSGKMKSICTLLKWLFIGRAHSTFIKFENSKSLIKNIRFGQGILSIDRITLKSS